MMVILALTCMSSTPHVHHVADHEYAATILAVQQSAAVLFDATFALPQEVVLFLFETGFIATDATLGNA